MRGNTIKYLCMPQDILSKIPDEAIDTSSFSSRGRGGRRGGRGVVIRGDRGCSNLLKL